MWRRGEVPFDGSEGRRGAEGREGGRLLGLYFLVLLLLLGVAAQR